MVVLCICFIGKQNNPLYMRVVGSEEPLKLHQVVHASLDIVDEIVAPSNKAGGGAKAGRREKFLGLLCPIQHYKVYGYLASTGIKIMVVLSEEDVRKDSQVSEICSRLHELYVDLSCNPFANLEKGIQSASFDAKIAHFLGS